jgi:hypothetical protein
MDRGAGAPPRSGRGRHCCAALLLASLLGACALSGVLGDARTYPPLDGAGNNERHPAWG